MKQTFEDFLIDIHTKNYIGPNYAGNKDSIVDNFNDWLTILEADDFLKYGNQFAKEQSKELLGCSKRVMAMLEEHGGSIVPYLLDTDENAGEFLRQAIAKAEGGDK